MSGSHLAILGVHHDARFLPDLADPLIPADEALIPSRWPKWEDIEKAIHADFPKASLAEQVLVQSRDKYLDSTALAKQLRRLQANWTDVGERLRDPLIPTAQLQKMLANAGAPHVPEDIGISRERLATSYRQAQRIRSRYTVLDVVLEADWWTPCVDQLFETEGLWHDG